MALSRKETKELADKEKLIKKLDDKEKKNGSLSAKEIGERETYLKRVAELTAKLNPETTTTNTNAVNTQQKQKQQQQQKPSSTETLLTESEQKAQEAADVMNEGNEKKVGDAGSATQTAKDMANTVDANIEENVPTWFWREAREMAPTDKAKRGFIISNYLTNRLGTALSNTGAIVQNNGGSGGGQIKEQGGSYIDQYRQGKLEQALANRKAKQDSLLQRQIDALKAIGASEDEARVIQNKLRNSKHLNKYNRLTNEQQVFIQGLLYTDTQGKIDDAVLGNLVDRIMEGKDVSLEQLATSVLTAAGMKNAKQMTTGASNVMNKAIQFFDKTLEAIDGWGNRKR